MSRVKVILIGCISIVALLTMSCQNQSQADANSDEEEQIPVYVTSIDKGKIENAVRYLGNIEGYNEVVVYSQIPNKITSVEAEVNDWVEAGDLLATVKNTQLEQAVKQAKSGLESARASYENVLTEWERTKKLYKENAISKSKYDAVKTQKQSAKSGLEQAEAALESARENYNDSFIKAPITGIVSARNYDLGDQTSPQRPAYSIVNMERVKIKVDVVEEDLGQIQKGNPVYVEVNSYPDTIFKGQVEKVYPTINPQTRTATVEVVLKNDDKKLKSGMYATVNIVTESSQNTLVIPSYAVIERTSRNHLGGELSNTEIVVNRHVFVVNNSTAYRRDIEAGVITDDKIEVVGGLKEGETLVTRGQYKLADSSKVNIVTD
ncbi:MAG: efflux RND transporter periplasmic adaptor subunit [Candidatus Marinimicrobia bacterium]|nr:efflux RND transporter periplasmic adaptor subunit [Candidatus Neomarinimicrobiota bacterium]